MLLMPSSFSCCCFSVTKSCLILWDPMDCGMESFPVLHHLLELSQTHVHWVGDAIQPLILCHPLLLLPSIYPSIRVFSNELALPIRWPKYWSFRFSISPSYEYWFPLGLTGFISWLSKGLSRVFSSIRTYQFFSTQPSLQSNSHIHTWPLEKP